MQMDIFVEFALVV